MSDKTRASAEEIQNQIAQAMAQADALNQKAQGPDGLTPEEQKQLADLVAQIEQLQSDLASAQTSQRLAAAKDRMAEPTRPAVRIPATYKTEKKASTAEGLQLWLRSQFADNGITTDDHYKARTAGFTLGSTSARLPVNYDRLNFKTRTTTNILTKGGSHKVDDYIPQTYSDKVVEYLTYASPFLGVLSSETTSDGNLRTYFKIDDTALKSAYITASSGTEADPTIPDVNLTSGSVDIGCFDITSGFQKVSFQALRDSAVSLEDKVAKANANSHARKLEDEIINAAGNGATGVQGLFAVDNALDPVSAFDADALEDMYFAVPQQYRGPCVWLCNSEVMKDLRKNLKDGVERSLFDKNVVDSVEWDTLMGKRFYVSDYVPADTILFFNPEFYQLRLVEGQIFEVLNERFAPHKAWYGIMSFGGAWLGPTGATGAVHSLTLGS